MQGRVGEVPEIVRLAERHGKSPAQIAIRWGLQRGVVIIPKSARRERIVANAAVFDFELSPDEMALVDSLDRGRRLGADPDDFDF
jgi:diketogulonate reductase-like aldo/keto reductase